MKKLLFIFVIAMPSLILSMENGAIKLYSIDRLKQVYAELFPVSDGSLNEGWGSRYGGITFKRSASLAFSLAFGPLFISVPVEDKPSFMDNVLDPSPLEYYQPKITDMAIANLLVYCQRHEAQMDRLQQHIAEINNGINQQRVIGNQIDQLKRGQDTEDHQCTQNTVLGRRRDCIRVLQQEIEATYNLRTADITTLRENNRERDRTLWRHENQINQLERGIYGCNPDAERYRANIITLENNSDNHSTTIDRHAQRIGKLQQDFRDHVQATDDKYENGINQFVRKKRQEIPSIKKQDSLRNAHIKELLKDVAILKKTLNQWIPNTATLAMNTSVACSTNIHHMGGTIPYITNNFVEMDYDEKKEESTTSSCSTTDKIVLKKY